MYIYVAFALATSFSLGRFVHCVFVYCDSSLSMQLEMFLNTFMTRSLQKWTQVLLYGNLYVKALLMMVIGHN